jgi:hypothetical protein
MFEILEAVFIVSGFGMATPLVLGRYGRISRAEERGKPMRYVLGLCLLALAVPVFAGDPGNPHLALAPLTSWEGKYSEELIAEWGKPRKTKRHGEGGRVLVYRLRFSGSEMIGDTVISWSEAGCQTDAWNSATPKVIATQKVKFYVDAEGIVRGQESAPRKWKQKNP